MKTSANSSAKFLFLFGLLALVAFLNLPKQLFVKDATIVRTAMTLESTVSYNDVIKDDTTVIGIGYVRNETQQHTPPCQLQHNPVPMVLISLGRSGTSSMYQVLSTLAGNEFTRIFELTGSSTTKSKKFFREKIPADDNHGDWILDFLCQRQIYFPDDGVVGFKWKPFETIFTEEKALQGLELIAKMNDPQIKVIRSKRNLLDVVISRHKHKTSKRDSTEKIRAHCQKDDEECIQKQIKAGTGIDLPTEKLIHYLQDLTDMEKRTDELLDRMNVPTIHVHFEKLFSTSNDTSEWTKIFKYLGVGPMDGLDKSDVERAGHAATSAPFHNATLNNYGEVKVTLEGTVFESLLH